MVVPKSENTILIDGSYGEGGGQILRTSLALSCVLRTPIEIRNIRKTRPKPGLQPQHLTAVKAAAKLSQASVEGAELASTAIRFLPGETRGGDYSFDVSETRGSAGSTGLVFQTILLPLIFGERPSAVTLIGGTHVPWSPTFHYLERVFLPVIRSLNASVELAISEWGWYPQGQGRIQAKVTPQKHLKGVDIGQRGPLKSVKGISAVSNLPVDIALRQRSEAVQVLSQKGIMPDIEIMSPPSIGKGTFLFLLSEFENSRAAFDSLGARGKRAETVADEACSALTDFLDSSGAVDFHLADQLVPYLALATGTSEFTTSRITRHLITNIWVVKQFVNVDIKVEGNEGEAGSVRINGRGYAKAG